jgi:magnesium transporter
MIAYYAKRSPGEDFEQISRPIESGMWTDGSNLSDNELDELIKRHDLDPNVVYDVRDRGELPRLEFSGGSAYVFLRLPHLAKSGRIGAIPLLAVVKDGTFVTMSIGDTLPPTEVGLSTLPITTEQSQTLLLGTIAGVIAQFEDLIGHTSRSISDTASRLKTHDVTNRDFIHFVTVEANLSNCRMNLESTLAVVHRLHENKHETLNDDSLEALDDIALHIQQLLVAIDSHAQSVESIRNAYSTVANNTLNQRMKTLTVFTVLITLPNVFYGMYGMNVSLPYGDAPWAYGAIVGFTVLLILVVFLIAKRLRIF